MKFVTALIAYLCASCAFGACPALPEDAGARITVQRTYLSSLSSRPNSIFQFADCAAQWAGDAIDSDSIPSNLERPTWLLAKDLADVLRQGAEGANPENAKRYRKAWRVLAEAVLDVFKEKGFSTIDKRDKRQFILYHGHNMQSLGAPGAKEYIDDLEGLEPVFFGPELVDQLVRAMDSCAAWDFVQGANRTTKEQKESMCSDKCLDYAGTVANLLKPVGSVTARSASRRYNEILAKCGLGPSPQDSVSGGQQ